MHEIMQRIKKRHEQVTISVVKRVPASFTQSCVNGLGNSKVYSIDAKKK
ncbi:hypothetical protein V6B14_22050 (plasmid) [Sporosarcina psychrophila]